MSSEPRPDAPTPRPPGGSTRLAAITADERAYPVQVLGVRAPIRVSGERDARAGQIARTQRSVVSRAQLRAAAISDDAIDRMVRRGQLHRRHPGVYILGHDALAPLGLETAALLAVGLDAVLCQFSAVELWRLLPPPATPGSVDVLLHGRHAHARPGIALHRTKSLAPRDVRIHQGLPVTSPARTLLDLAERVSGRRLERALEEALARRLTRLSQLQDVLARAGGRRGAPKLAALLADGPGTTRTRSEGEEALLALIRQAGLPEPLVNARVHGYEVDFYWPDHGLVLELDSHSYHLSRSSFEHDRRKGAVLTAAGLRVTRATWWQIDQEPLALVGRLAQALAISW